MTCDDTQPAGSANAAVDAQDALRLGQARLLEMVAKGEDLHDTLGSLMRLIESQSPGVLCSVLLLDEDGIHIRPGAGPSLPESYMAALDGLPIGPCVGSCGTAMYRKEPVIVTDIQQDPLWAPYKGLVAPFGYRACWSVPIFLDREQVLGSFAMYYKEVRSPGPAEQALIGVATHIAGIAMERKRRETELDRHRFHLEELVAARTAELSAAKASTDASNLALSVANQELATALNTLSTAQEELVRREKLAALGSLVAGVAHELNTPIGNSLMVASTLVEHARAFSASYAAGLTRARVEDYIQKTRDAGDLLERNLQRAAVLVGSFKQVAMEQINSQRRSFKLAHILAGLDTTHVRAHATVTHDIVGQVEMEGYPGALAEVLNTLVNNAWIHGYPDRDDGSVTISARNTSTDGVEISVRDQGAGIAAANLGRIYDPFFTTRLGQGSSGLGLYIAYNIVTGILGGSIQVSSERGVGTQFKLRLPRVAPVFHGGKDVPLDDAVSQAKAPQVP
jgi:signal transduction histidine kinase